MAGLKINIDDLDPDVDGDDPARMSHEGLRVGGLTVSTGGLVTSMGHRYPLCPEDIVANRTDILGQGSSGSVRRCVHRATGRVLALKEIKVTGHSHMQEIRRELETLHGTGTTSPYLVDFHGAFCHEGSVFIAMECMDGSLDRLSKPLPLEVLASVTRSILRGLTYLHREIHVIHRDLKPSNILYSADGRIKISDFGVSSSLDCNRSDVNSFVGTLAYMSPERLKGESYSFSADIWSFALVIAELAIGCCPFMERPDRSGAPIEARFWTLLAHFNSDRPVLVLPASLDPALADFITICVQKDPRQRPTCDDLLRHSFVAGGTGEEEDKRTIREWLAAVSKANEERAASGEVRGPAPNSPRALEVPLNLDDALSRLLP